MTHDQFHEWLKYHGAAFPEFSSWLANRPRKPTEGGKPSQEEVQQAAFRVLYQVDLDDAKAATDAMSCGAEPKPKMYGDHAREIRQIANRERSSRPSVQPWQRRTVDGVETFHCLDCHDDGRVVIWHPRDVIQRVMDGDPWEEITSYDCALRCKCSAGQAKKYGRMPKLVYDSEQMLLRRPGDSLKDAETRQEITEFAARLQAGGGFGGHPEFADFA